MLLGLFVLVVVREIPWGDYEEAVPAFAAMLLMPFTYSITNGIGAGFIVYACLKDLAGKAREVHPLLWAASAAFFVYFLSTARESLDRFAYLLSQSIAPVPTLDISYDKAYAVVDMTKGGMQ